MKRTIFFLLVAVLLAMPAHAQYLPAGAVQTDQNTGYMDITGATSASMTISLPATSITDVGAYIPIGCVGFKLTAFGGDVICNDDGPLATGSIYVGDKIASGSFMKWESKKAGSMNIYAAPNGTSPATLTMTVW